MPEPPVTHRIAYLIDSLNRAGTQTALVHLARGLAEKGWEQRVYCLNNRVHPAIQAQLAAAGVEVVVIGKLPLLFGTGFLRLFLDFRSWAPQVVQTLLPVADIVGRTTAYLARVPVVVTSIRARNIDKPALLRRLDRLTMPWADRVVFNAENVIPFSIAEEGVQPGQVVCIPNGVAARPGAAFPDEFRQPEGAILLGTVGRLRPQKGIEVLIQAMPAVLQAVPGVRLLVIGDGPQRPELEALAVGLKVQQAVDFLGERTDVPDLLAGLDLYVHPAYFEGMPNAVMEAMAAGLPVVATDVDGARELITSGETGWLVPPGKPETLAAQITSVLQDRDSARRIGTAAAALMAENYSIEQMVGAFDQLYRDLSRRTNR
jgi:glycosyltransferase involved in cell wall biosynthesis